MICKCNLFHLSLGNNLLASLGMTSMSLASKEAEKVRIEAKGKADANRILAASLTTNVLKDKGIEATIKLAESGNSKVVIIGSGEDGLPLILGNN